ncbi:DUF4349 domain-containing protein [Salinispora arenicola]|uniref:DUF4349 domain-containing protein n=1 Tax=Salinispora arenicola TaxID=168697 RepID=UPI00142F6782|nr:DUF4349 domain-containing protein [Salinispora arenicola]NIL40518.1 DUF4349 domain-containing protein [Salinispora arenicola]
MSRIGADMDGCGARRRGAALVAVLIGVLLVSGCGAGGDSGVGSGTGDDAASADGARAGAGQPDGQAEGSDATADLRVDQRAIVYTGSMRVQVPDVEQAAREAIALTTAVGGFVGSDQRRSANGNATVELTLRVPAAKFTTVVEQVAELGKRQRQEISTEDVTEETVDLDARITTQRARVENARRLLGEAQSISDLVSLENELARREADLASLEAKKRRLADLTALSSIAVSLVGPDAATEDDASEFGFVAGLQGGWKVFLLSWTVLLTVLGAVLPWLLLIGVPVGTMVWLLRRRRPALPAPPAHGTGTGSTDVTGGGVAPPAVSPQPRTPGARSAP